MTIKEKMIEYSKALADEGVISDLDMESCKTDFESGAQFVIEEIYKALTPKEISTPIVLLTAVYDCLEELERE